jgi:LL-diaminopimelate aminotransferase
MAGCRIGMAVGNQAAIAGMTTSKGSTDAGIFQVVQAAGVAALEGPQDIVEHNIKEYRGRRDIVIDALRGVGIDVPPPRAGIYVWAPVPPGITSVGFADRLFATTGVVVTPGVGYGSQGEGYVRLSLAGSGDRLDEAMRRLVASWSEIVRGPVLGIR